MYICMHTYAQWSIVGAQIQTHTTTADVLLLWGQAIWHQLHIINAERKGQKASAKCGSTAGLALSCWPFEAA